MLVRRFRQLQKAIRLVLHAEFRRGLFMGIGASIEHSHQLSGLALRTVVDIGANVGQFSLLIRGLYPQARIFAFEPLSRPAGKYTALFGQVDQAHFFQKAIAPVVAKQMMHVSRRDDSSSLLAIGTNQVEYAPGTDEIGTEEVSLATLDECIKPEDISSPALLKLDVQGYELEALKGCESLLAKFDYVYAEVSFFTLYENQVLADELIAWLAAHNFHICGAGNPAYGADKRIVQLDMMFRRKS